MSRHRTRATVLSSLLMGLGQIYNKQYMKGALMMAFEAASVMYFILNLGYAFWESSLWAKRREPLRICSPGNMITPSLF